jgi:hypothetical protein
MSNPERDRGLASMLLTIVKVGSLGAAYGSVNAGRAQRSRRGTCRTFSLQALGFTLRVTPDQILALADLAGKPVILALYPADWNSGDQMALYNEVLSEFHKHHAELVGLSVDGACCHQAFARDRRLKLLADFEPKRAAEGEDTQTIRPWHRIAANNRRPVSTSAGGEPTLALESRSLRHWTRKPALTTPGRGAHLIPGLERS